MYFNKKSVLNNQRGSLIQTFQIMLKKALYDLKQAPRAWYEILTEFLINNGYNRGGIDKTLFVKNCVRKLIISQIYVDDIMFGGISYMMVNTLFVGPCRRTHVFHWSSSKANGGHYFCDSKKVCE